MKSGVNEYLLSAGICGIILDKQKVDGVKKKHQDRFLSQQLSLVLVSTLEISIDLKLVRV